MHHRGSPHNLTDTSRIALIFILSIAVTIRFSSAQTTQSQDSLCIDPSLVQNAAKSDGITDPANPDKFAKSLTSSNNFIQFCAGKKLTNGEQNPDGSCNPTPMGLLPSSKNIPSVRISSPSPKKKIAAHQEFEIIIAARNIELGFFTSPLNTYYLAPQQLNQKGQIQGHIHLVIQLVTDNGPLDPLKFVFFKGIADSAIDGNLNVTVTGGLPDGTYRISTLTSSMNHQLVAVSVAKRGPVDDSITIIVGTGVSSPEKAGGETGGSSLLGLNGGSTTLSVDQNHDKSNHISGEGNGKISNVENGQTNGKKHKSSSKRKACRARRSKRSTVSKRQGRA